MPSPLDFLFPKRCVSCGKVGDYVCRQCSKKIDVYNNQKCLICMRSSIDGITHSTCRTKLSIDGAITVFHFSDPTKSAIYRLKYRWISDLASKMIDLVIDHLGQDHFIFNKKFAVTYVPLHQKRENWRGFNQAELLAKQVAQKAGQEFVDGVLIKSKNTKPQVELSKEERLSNVRGAFAIDSKDKIFKKEILLVDDLRTTGATLRNCAQVLKRSGAKSVWGLTVAAN